MCESGAIANRALPASKKEINISWQDQNFPDGFDLKNKLKLSIRSVDYLLKWNSEARFWKTAHRGSTRELSWQWWSSQISICAVSHLLITQSCFSSRQQETTVFAVEKCGIFWPGCQPTGVVEWNQGACPRGVHQRIALIALSTVFWPMDTSL